MHRIACLPRWGVALAAALAALRPLHATPLDDYVAEPDLSFAWSLAATIPGPGYTAYILDMNSQTWRDAGEVDRPLWQHYVTIVKPQVVQSSTGLLQIEGGSNSGNLPGVRPELVSLALSTGSVVTSLRTVPNQSLQFSDEAFSRSEDAIIAYSWDKYLRGGDSYWPVQLPMAKSGVRAMDAVQQFLASPGGGATALDDFVVTGASKRGWTTWLTAAVDSRVRGIMPVVIDLLNMEPSFNHHFDSLGFWAPALQDYVDMGITNWRDTLELRALFDIVDPYAYRDRLTMPKYLVNSAGDDFFVVDSSTFYFDDLPGEKYLRYVPNTNHSLAGSDALDGMAAFYSALLTGAPLPEFTWELLADGRLRVETATAPVEVRLWQATNPDARDFRQSEIGNAYTSVVLTDQGGGVYQGDVPRPGQGWTAYFIELTFDAPGAQNYKFTTNAYVIGVPEPAGAGLAAAALVGLVLARTSPRRRATRGEREGCAAQ